MPDPIPSRPVYGRLAPRPGTAHLLVADAGGAEAILDLAPPPGFWATAQILYVPGAAGARYMAPLAALGAAFHDSPSIPAVLPRLTLTLANARMGLQVYLAGTEGLIGQAMLVALNAGIDHAAIQTEHRGSLARRVQCVHCKGITEDVTTQPAPCAHCGALMFVRDHYSRRIAAFQGVAINAEDPSEQPPREEAFP